VGGREKGIRIRCLRLYLTVFATRADNRVEDTNWFSKFPVQSFGNVDATRGELLLLTMSVVRWDVCSR
jgi:hypothetical protein